MARMLELSQTGCMSCSADFRTDSLDMECLRFRGWVPGLGFKASQSRACVGTQGRTGDHRVIWEGSVKCFIWD